MNRNNYIPVIAFFSLLILSIPFESGFTIQSLTGWKSVIPNTVYLEIIVLILISIITFVYWKISKRESQINPKLFIVHFIMTIPIVLWARFNFPIRQIASKNSTDILGMIDLINRILYTVIILFFVGQTFFVILLLKIRKVKQAAANSNL